MPNINKIKRTAKRNRLKLILIILLAITIFFISKNFDGNKIDSPAFEIQETKTLSTPTSSPDPGTQDLLTAETGKLPGKYLVYIKDLKTGETYSTGANEKIPSASIYKLAVMFKTFDSLEKGELKKDQLLSSDLAVEKALELMIKVSDNESALLLAEKLGWANINKFLQSKGISGFNLMLKDYPTTTARATGDLLEKIYTGEAVSKEASGEMIKLLLAQTRNDRIPLNLPINIEVAHKTGELDNFRHDAGIVYGLKSDYIFVFLTETPVPENSYQNIAQLSKKLFEALEK